MLLQNCETSLTLFATGLDIPSYIMGWGPFEMQFFNSFWRAQKAYVLQF